MKSNSSEPLTISRGDETTIVERMYAAMRRRVEMKCHQVDALMKAIKEMESSLDRDNVHLAALEACLHELGIDPQTVVVDLAKEVRPQSDQCGGAAGPERKVP